MRHLISFLILATPALAEVPVVVTDIPPVQALVAQVMGDLGQPELLLAKGADEHDFQLRPSQARAVAGAGLVVWIGPELTPWLDNALSTRPEGAASLALLAAEGTLRRDYAHPDADHGPTDPHVWLDPENAEVWLGLIAAELARLDPEHAATYTANAAAAAEGLEALDAEVAAVLAQVKGRPLISQHDAYGYLAARYGLDFVGSVALGDAASPGASRLLELRQVIEAQADICLFPEAQHDPAMILELAEGTGARIGGALDPVGSTLDVGPGLYAALMRDLAATIADCAGR